MPVKIKGKKKPVKMANAPRGKRKTTQRFTSSVAINTKSISRSPNLSMARGATVVTHREVAAETINNSVTYHVGGTFAMQPALSMESHGTPMGSWIPSIAKEYDNYEFASLKVHYVTTCSTLTAGLVVLTYDPNPDGLPPSTFSAARNAQACVTGPIRNNLTLDLTRYVKGRKLLTRTGFVTSYPLYDAGRLFIAATAGADSSPVGYLEFEYTIKFSNPQSELSNARSDVAATVQRGYSTVSTTVANGYVSHFGTTNVNRNCGHVQYLLNNPAISYGMVDSLITVNTPVNRTTNLSYVSTNSNVTYSIVSGLPCHTFNFKTVGRYRLQLLVPGDYENLATFGMEVLRWPSGANLASSSPVGTYDVALGAAGELIDIPSLYAVNRGFKTLDTVGATAKCDLALGLDTTVYVDDVTDRYCICVGVRNVTEIVENTNASMVLANDLGFVRAVYTFMGSI